MADKDFTVTLNDAQQAGVAHAVELANDQITRDNDDITRRNESTVAETEVESEKELYTPETYIQYVMGQAADSYARQSVSMSANDLADKMSKLPAEKKQQIDAILASS